MSTQQEEQRLTQKKKQEEQLLAEQRKQEEAGLLEAVVGDNVLSILGWPAGLHRVQVKCVWDDRYRVNVFVGPDAVSSKIAHSYFLQADGNGKVLSSCPAIRRVYQARGSSGGDGPRP